MCRERHKAMTISTDKYKQSGAEANCIVASTPMAKKRKSYLYKRSSKRATPDATEHAASATSQHQHQQQQQQLANYQHCSIATSTSSLSPSSSSSASASSSSSSPATFAAYQHPASHSSHSSCSGFVPEHIEDMHQQMLRDCGINIAEFEMYLKRRQATSAPATCVPSTKKTKCILGGDTTIATSTTTSATCQCTKPTYQHQEQQHFKSQSFCERNASLRNLHTLKDHLFFPSPATSCAACTSSSSTTSCCCCCCNEQLSTRSCCTCTSSSHPQSVHNDCHRHFHVAASAKAAVSSAAESNTLKNRLPCSLTPSKDSRIANNNNNSNNDVFSRSFALIRNSWCFLRRQFETVNAMSCQQQQSLAATCCVANSHNNNNNNPINNNNSSSSRQQTTQEDRHQSLPIPRTLAFSSSCASSGLPAAASSQQTHHQPERRRRLSKSMPHKSPHPLSALLPNANTLLIVISLLSLCFVSSSQALATAMDNSLEASLTRFTRSAEKHVQLSSSVTKRATVDGAARLSRPETVCKSIDVRNTPQSFRQLANCTIIEGFLLISLINGHSADEYNETFPLLTEVTDFVIVFQVYYLRSLGQLFPNLRVIRGRDLFEGYALLVYSNAHIEELGLSNLLSIPRGGVRIERNDVLCYVKTIDWSRIVSPSNVTEVFIEENRDLLECGNCPGDQSSVGGTSSSDLVCKQHHGRRNCWNDQHCQKLCPERCLDNCVDENTCCNESCLGGCSKNDVNECIVCRNFSINNTSCTDKCPPNYYTFLKRRCLTDVECKRIGTMFENGKQEILVPFNGECTTKCPNGYEKNLEKRTCVPCKGKCIKTCDGALIDGAARAKEMHGCNVIKGSLTISIKRASQILADLAYGLSQIEIITDYLMVQGTYGLFDLHFFKNLREIQGQKPFDGKYAFYVLENTDIESLWNPNQTVMIQNGTVYFHFNPKLCLNEIHKLLRMMKNQTHFDKNEVAEDSNGSRGSCNTAVLEVKLINLGPTVAVARVQNPIIYDDDRVFVGYQFLYIEDPYGNATKYGFRPCEDGWTVSQPSKELEGVMADLKPYTQYAYYVKTLTISTERRNAQSPIMHFTTWSDQPTYVLKLQGYANSSSEIVINWLPPIKPNGKLVEYRLRAHLDERVHQVESRNYCKDPLKGSAVKVDKPIITHSEKQKNSPDCKCPKQTQQGGYYFNEAEVESSIHASMQLENQLHNFVYVKKPSQSVKKPKKGSANQLTDAAKKKDANRSRRDLIEMNTTESFMLRHIRDTDVAAAKSNELQGENGQVHMDSEKVYFDYVTQTVNASVYEFVFTRLKHFSWYMLAVEACRAPEANNNRSVCSREVKIYVRTLMLADVDKAENLRADIETTNSSRTNVRLYWTQPKNPNGAVVSYTIHYELQAPDEVEEKKCVTEVDYIKLGYETNGYLLTGLQSGNYSIRIRTNTLAGEGLYSDKTYVYIKPNVLAPGIIAGIAVGTIVLLLVLAAIIFFIFRKRILATPSDLKMTPSLDPHYMSLQYIPDEWEVSRDQIIQLSSLGQGSFGMVYEGILKGETDTPCAIKTVNEHATDRERMNFLNEACVMKQFDTYHVVHLLGVCSRGQPALVIMELMKNGDLKSYLRAHRPDERDDGGVHSSNRGRITVSGQPPPLSRIYQMAIEIADGMAYLSAKKFVHRDLAARNCMVAADLTVKIGDFGMTRDIYQNDYYRKGTKGLLPVRWMPPESLRDGVYSTASDVFSYGVVLWEMATLASQPYQGLSNDQVLRYVIDNGVMERPENCPNKLYGLMQKCWHPRPSARPTFMEIIRYLYTLADPNFSKVSFYNSTEGQNILAKEIAERSKDTNDIFGDVENDTEDVTTPLRMEEYSGYKMENLVMDDDVQNSPYSMGSPMVISSTPDEQSRGSYSVSRILHPHSQLLNSAPSTSTGIRRLGSGTASQQLTHAHTHPHHRNLYQPTRFSQQQGRQLRHSDDVDANMQQDFEMTEDGVRRDSDDQGYEIYDPSPNYSEHVPSNVRNVHDEDDDDATAGQNLLAGSKGRQKQPTIMPLSTSMPDDVIGQQAAASLHPSTASAASSNASSKAGAAGKYQSLKAVADSLGSSIMPNRLRMMNKRLFNHKRSGSNASHKSTSSNPNSSSAVGGSINNLARGGRVKSMSGQNLGTIESGGSAGSYGANPRLFRGSSNMGTSDIPNYKRLDDSSAETMSGADSHRGKSKMPSTSGFAMGSQPSYRVLDESLNVSGPYMQTGEEDSSYKVMAPPGAAALQRTSGQSLGTGESGSYGSYGGQAGPFLTAADDDANYKIMQPPGVVVSLQPPPLSNEGTSSYVMMNEPAQKRLPETANVGAMHENDNPNYQVMCPLLPPTAAKPATIMPSTVLPVSMRSAARGAAMSSMSSSSSHESEEDDALHNPRDIKQELIPLSRRSSNDRSKKKHAKKSNRSRSQSSSSGKSATTNTASTIIPATAAAAAAVAAANTPPSSQKKSSPSSSTLSAKEKWWKEGQQQQQQQQPPQPPPNGFVGREA